MSDTDIDDIATKLDALDLHYQDKLHSLLKKQRHQKQALLQKLSSPRLPKHLSPPPTATPTVLSHSCFPLHRGDKVILRSTASIGRKGDLATVLCIDVNRVDIYVPHLNNTMWHIPRNLTHYPSKHSATTR